MGGLVASELEGGRGVVGTLGLPLLEEGEGILVSRAGVVDGLVDPILAGIDKV